MLDIFTMVSAQKGQQDMIVSVTLLEGDQPVIYINYERAYF